MSTPGRIAKFDSAGNVVDSNVTETAQANLGIGTAAPSVKMQIEGTNDPQTTKAIHRADHNKFMRLGVGTNGVALDFDSTSYFVMQSNTGGIGAALAGRELLRVTADGRVGIGTPAPSTSLHVAGNLILDPGSAPVLYTGIGGSEQNRYLQLINSPDATSASGLKAGGVLVADSYTYASPGKNDLIVKGEVGIGGGVTVGGSLTANSATIRGPVASARGSVVLQQDRDGAFVFIVAGRDVLVQLTTLPGAPNNGAVLVTDAAGAAQGADAKAGMFVDDAGRGVVRADLAEVVEVLADLKSFRVPHPTQPGKEIVYACIEGPEAAVYVRGTGQLVKGQASIPLPDHFVIVANPASMTAQVTPLSADSLGLAVVAKEPTGIVVKELHGGAGNYDFDWEVKCVRKGYEDYQATRPKDAGSAQPPVGRKSVVLPTELPPRT